MSAYDINSNKELVENMMKNELEAHKKYLAEHPNSLFPEFEGQLRELGYEFITISQIKSFLPKYKKELYPIILEYYNVSKIQKEKYFFASLLRHKEFEDFVPILLNEFFSENPAFDRWQIAEIIYSIGSKKYVDEYLKIISNNEFGYSRQMIILLVGKLKIKEAIPFLIKLLDESDITGQTINALGQYKNPELRKYFELFINHKNSFYKREAIKAIKKLKTP